MAIAGSDAVFPVPGDQEQPRQFLRRGRSGFDRCVSGDVLQTRSFVHGLGPLEGDRMRWVRRTGPSPTASDFRVAGGTFGLCQ